MREVKFNHAALKVIEAIGLTKDEWDEMNNTGELLTEKINNSTNKSFSSLIEKSIIQKRIMLHEDVLAPYTNHEVMEATLYINLGKCFRQ